MRRTAVAVLLIFGLVAAAPSSADHVETSSIQWACGGFGSGHPDDCGIDPVGGGRDVESRGDPVFGDAWLGDDARIVGVVLGDGDDREAVAVPIRMMNAHEIVNTEVGGAKVAITYCPLCGSGLTFAREFEFEGRWIETDFTASGYLWKHDMVMWDPVTNQLWTQIEGVPIAVLDGDRPDLPHADAKLAVFPTTISTWGDWRARHPDSTMLQPVLGAGSYREYAYGDYEETKAGGRSCSFGISGHRDCDVEGLHPKEQVVVTEVAGGAAFPVSGLLAEGGAGILAVSDRTLVATATPDGFVAMFDGTGHNFTADPSGLWLDDAGALWDLRSGTQLDGDGSLPEITSHKMFWFAWAEHHPGTALWLPEGGAPAVADGGRESDRPMPSVPVAWMVAALAIVGWIGHRTKGERFS